MKKNVLLAIIAIVILVVLVIIFVGVNNKTTENSPSSTSSGTSTEINGETQITLNQKTDIATLKDITISGTNDYFSITENVKWNPPSDDDQSTVSFSVSIPYKFVVDGNEYTGTYTLGDSSSKTNDDNNPKYDLEITNLTEQGIATVLITNK